MPENTIDLNCDIGESYGPYTMGDTQAMMQIVSSANVACGFHAGDPDVMYETVEIAKQANVDIGAHPGYSDVIGFGRRIIPCTMAEIERMVAYQIGALMGVASLVDHSVTHVKAHGALGNLGAADAGVAAAIGRAIAAVDRNLVFLAIAGTELEKAALDAGLPVAREIFADRAYDDGGQLVSRKIEGSLIHDPDEVSRRVLEMLSEQALIAQSGKRLPTAIDSICIHGDTPGAVSVAQRLRDDLLGSGVSIRGFAERIR